jgi:hypothetical protein
MTLDNSDTAVHIHHKTWQPITLGVYESETGGALILEETESPPQSRSTLKPVMNDILLFPYRTKRQHADGDTFCAPVPRA